MILPLFIQPILFKKKYKNRKIISKSAFHIHYFIVSNLQSFQTYDNIVSLCYQNTTLHYQNTDITKF